MLANRTIVWIGRVISILLSLLFAMSAFMKMRHGPEVMQGMAHLGLPESLIMPLGILEISCVVIYAIPATAVWGPFSYRLYRWRDPHAYASRRSLLYPDRARTVCLARAVPPRETPERASSAQKETS